MKRIGILFNKSVLALLLAFIVLALGIDLVFSHFIIMKSSISNENKINRLLTNKSDKEVPIFGSSKARSAFIPDSLGSNFYNYGMEKCGFDVINFLLETELKKDKESPIFIEVNHRSFISDPTHTINLGTYVPNLKNKNVEDFLERNNRMEFRYKIPGLRYFGSYGYYLRYFVKDKTGSKKIISHGGNFSRFVLPQKVFQTLVDNRLQLHQRKKELDTKIASYKLVISSRERAERKALNIYLNFTYNEKLWSDFENLIANHTQRDIYLVYTPQHWSEKDGISNLSEMTQQFTSLSTKYSHLNYLDFSNLSVPDSGFKNTSHLNLIGAQIFSSALKKELN